MKQYILFGAGEAGKIALSYLKHENVLCFIDNDADKWGGMIEGKEIISLDKYISCGMQQEIMICAAWENTCAIIEQLKNNNISNYTVFTEQLFEKYDFIINQYEEFEGVSEESWNAKLQRDKNNARINAYVNKIKKDVPLFHEIEIETINRCNGVCSFCPVNRNIDSRIEEKMSRELFEKIIGELESINYAGRVALFSNNEPFLDDRIVEFSKYAREHLPKAKIHMFTNGTLLDLTTFLEIIDYLDELIIDNYNQQLQLIPNVKRIEEYLDNSHLDDIRKKVKILLRKPNEVLTSRGGDAPNRENIINVGEDTCALPFQQMIVRPSGKVSLCCNDPLGKETLGDLRQDSILDVWYGERYHQIRSMITEGRKNLEHCQNCDTYMTI